MLNVDSKYEIDILQYCKLNNIEDVDLFVTQCFKQGFDIKKYGFLGKTDNDGEKDLIKEVIREIRVEVPVEVIKEIEKIVEVVKEVPIETIKEVEKIVEVPVEKVVTKIEYISDKTNENELVYKIHELESTISNLNNEMSKKDENLDELRRNLDDKLDDKSNDKLRMLSETLMKTKTQLRDKDVEIEDLKTIIRQLESRLNPTGAVYMKGSNINENL